MPFKPGDQVRLIAGRLRTYIVISGPSSVADTCQYCVRFNNGMRTVNEQYLEILSNISPGSLFIGRAFDGFYSFLRLITCTRLTKSFAATFLIRFASKIDFLPYQWLPLIRMLNTNEQRILIADEVGLRKNIEADSSS